MQPDDVLPNDGTYFLPREPVSQSNSRKKEVAKTLEALPILQDLIHRLSDRVKFYEKNSSIPEEVRDDPQKFLIMSNSHLLTAQVLLAEKEWIEDLIEEALPKKNIQ